MARVHWLPGRRPAGRASDGWCTASALADINPSAGSGCKGGPAAVKVCGQNGILYDNVYPLVA